MLPDAIEDYRLLWDFLCQFSISRNYPMLYFQKIGPFAAKKDAVVGRCAINSCC